jgi:hypothetical protein
MDRSGSCLCGKVKFTATQLNPEFHACHCSQCRRWSGGPGLSVDAGGVSFSDASTLATFDSSEWAERGFCTACGSSLFYRLKETGQYMISMGTLEDQSGLTLAGEIYIDEKPEGYDFAGKHSRLTGEEFLASMGQPSG